MRGDNVNFFLNMKVPTKTQQQKKVTVKNGRVIFYEPQELKNVREMYMFQLNAHKPRVPIKGAIQVHVSFQYQAGVTHKDGWKTTKPDADNMVKCLLDSMTKCGYWKDDSQVASLIINKFYAEQEGIFIRIESLEGMKC